MNSKKARKANATGKVYPFLNESEQLFKRLGPKHTHKHDKKLKYTARAKNAKFLLLRNEICVVSQRRCGVEGRAEVKAYSSRAKEPSVQSLLRRREANKSRKTGKNIISAVSGKKRRRYYHERKEKGYCHYVYHRA